MSSLVLTFTSDRVAADLDSDICHSEIERTCHEIANHLKRLSSRAELGALDIHTSAADPVAASGTITLVSCATDTVTIGKTTFTGTGSPTTSLHFETDGDDAADAAALCAAINAHDVASTIVVATVAENVVTVTARQKGIVGNFLALSETGSTITCTGSGFLAGGTGGVSSAPDSYTVS